jgi:hypothetical protein
MPRSVTPAPTPKPEKRLYEFSEDRWFDNRFYKKGQTDRFFPEQVKYEAHSIKLAVAKAPADSAKA